MTFVYPLEQLITRLTANSSIPVFQPWEMCALKLISISRPSLVYFFCKSASHCPSKELYKFINVPYQTLFGIGIQALPTIKRTDMVFLPFQDDFIVWNNETIQKYRWSSKNRFKMVFVGDMSTNRSRDLAHIQRLFHAMWESGVVSSAVVLKNDSSAQIFTYIPFRNNSICEDTSPVLLGECVGVANKVFDLTYKVYNFNGCPLRVSVLYDRPFIIYPLGGRFSDLIKAVAFVMNATLEIMSGEKGANCGPDEYIGTRRHVIEGKAHLSFEIAHQAPCSTMRYIHVSLPNCYSWCTPIVVDTHYVYKFIVGQFQPCVWTALFVASFAVILSVLLLRSRVNERVSTNKTVYLAFALFAVVPIDFRSTPVRFIVGLWLAVSLVLQTGYEAELKSRIAVPLGTEKIQDLKTMVDKEFDLCTAKSGLEILKGQEDPFLQELYTKVKICQGKLYDNMVRAADAKDRAIFTFEIRCRVSAYDINPDDPLLYPSTGGCWRTDHLVTMVTMPGSPFYRKWGEIQMRCSEAGLMTKWLSLKPSPDQKGRVRPYSFKQLLPSLFILGSGCLLAFAILLIEKALFLVKTREMY